jgi:RNA polymerase sigma-70 factor, ECF subfamily
MLGERSRAPYAARGANGPGDATSAREPLLAVPAEPENCAAAYEQFRDSVWRTLRRLGVGSDQLADATHDVFEVACRRWEEFQGRSTRKTWIFGIAIRVAHGYRRRKKRQLVLLPQETFEPAESEATWQRKPLADPHLVAARRQASALLQNLLGELHPRHQEVLLLVDVEGLTVREAASALEVTDAAASRRLDRARANFNQALQRFHARHPDVHL